MTEKRLKILLYNALSVIENECAEEMFNKDSIALDWLKAQIGITEEELKEIEFI